MRTMLKLALATTALIATQGFAQTYTFVDGTSQIILFGEDAEEPAGGDLAARLVLTLDDVTDGLFTFSYELFNESDPFTQEDSRVSSFGFDDNPMSTSGAIVSGDFNSIHTDGDGQWAGPEDVLVCLSNNSNNCSGPGGATLTDSAAGVFTLQYASNVTSIDLSNFSSRYQSTGLDGNGSGYGSEIPPVPEPGTWLMMLLGFGAVGYSLRRRRINPQHVLQAV